MFAAARESVSIAWASKGQGSVEYVDAFKRKKVSCQEFYRRQRSLQLLQANSVVEDIQSGALKESEIESWLSRTDTEIVEGGIRLLVLQREKYQPMDYPVSDETFQKIENHFHLHAATLPSFSSDSGTYSRYLEFDDTNTVLKRICKVHHDYISLITIANGA